MDALLELDDDILHPPWSPVGRAVTLGLVSVGAKVVMHLLNRVSVDQEGLKRFRELTMQREPGVGLLTYSNHTRLARLEAAACAWAHGRVHVVCGCMRAW